MTDRENPDRPTAAAPPPHWPGCYPPYLIEDEINLLEYWQILVRGRITIAGITAVSTAAAVAAALLMTPVYRSEALLAPVSEERTGGLSAIAGQFGGLASMAGVDLGGSDTVTEEAIATLESRAFTDPFIKEEKLLPVLFADEWDEDEQKWRPNDPLEIPSAWDAYELFDRKVRSVSVDSKTGLITLAIEWSDPALAARWANELVRRINRHRREEAIRTAEKGIHYLEQQLEQTGVVEMRQAIYRLIEAQTKSIMLANVRDEFAFKVIDPAVAAEKPVRPRRLMIAATGFVGGLLLSLFWVLIREAVRKARLRNPARA